MNIKNSVPLKGGIYLDFYLQSAVHDGEGFNHTTSIVQLTVTISSINPEAMFTGLLDFRKMHAWDISADSIG